MNEELKKKFEQNFLREPRAMTYYDEKTGEIKGHLCYCDPYCESNLTKEESWQDIASE